VGEIIVSLFLLDKIGRKHTIAVGGIVTAIGVAMQVAASEWKLFLAGRLINCKRFVLIWGFICLANEGTAIGFGVVFLESPVWIGENCRPELRGFFLCIMNGSIVLGQFLLSFVFQISFHNQENLRFADVLQKAPLQSKESGHTRSSSSSNLPLLVGLLM
jgi:MFS family permease